MRSLGVLIFVLFACLPGFAQEYALIGTVPVKSGIGFSTDYLGNIYLYSDGDVVKYDDTGKPAGTFSTRDYGSVGYLDVSNPLKTLVVYPDFSKALILDSRMSSNATLDLAPPGKVPVNLICTSRDEGYWIYDESDFRLKKVDSQLNVTIEGAELTKYAGAELKPDKILESSQWLYVHDQVAGVMVFDRYGTYYKTFREDNIMDFQADGNNLFFLLQDQIIAVDIRTGAKTNFAIPVGVKPLKARIAPKRLIILTGEEVRIYAF